MAKNIDYLGAIFPDVPSIRLPQQGGGLVSFDDTTDATATADKILQGYTAYANGEKLTGTASGGITPSGTISITQNGIVDVTQYANADVNVSGGGGGASNVVQGSFTLTSDGAHDIDIPYEGDGYIIAFLAFVKSGRESGSSWSSLVQRYAMESWGMYKLYPNTAPTYTGGNYTNDGGARFNVYKSSKSSAKSYSAGAEYSYSVYNNTNASNYDNTAISIRSKNKFSAYGSGSGRGFALNIEYEYIAVYSE